MDFAAASVDSFAPLSSSTAWSLAHVLSPPDWPLPDAPPDGRMAAVWSRLPEYTDFTATAPPGTAPILADRARERLGQMLGLGAEPRETQSDYAAALAAHPSVKFCYEAAVCGGIPIINALQSAYLGDRITSVTGIMNGTTNYMLTKMESEGAAYGEVLAEAQALGFAEAAGDADAPEERALRAGERLPHIRIQRALEQRVSGLRAIHREFELHKTDIGVDARSQIDLILFGFGQIAAHLIHLLDDFINTFIQFLR